MTERIREFLRSRVEDGPCLVVDLDVVRDNYTAFAKALPDTRVFYAVKANPAPEVLSLLTQLGSCFDTASLSEIEAALAAGCTPDRISYGNTIKKERDIARSFELGVRLYAVDCKAEVDKIARSAPGSKVFCRILSDCIGAEWPLSRKFGCEPGMAVEVLEHALKSGLEPHGVSFHVGSQQRDHFRGRIGFDRVEDLRQGHIAPEQLVCLTDDVEVDDQIGRFGLPLSQKFCHFLVVHTRMCPVARCDGSGARPWSPRGRASLMACPAGRATAPFLPENG